MNEASPILEIKNLHAAIDGREILKGIDLCIRGGEIHAIMGPNGSGKSTLAQVLAGHEAYAVTAGSVTFLGQDLLALPPEERARQGVFLAFQYPLEIPGVANTYFLKTALNAIRKHRGLPELDAMEFLALIRQKMKLLEVDPALLQRAVNEGFSGGEKKRNEILQLAVLEPQLAILDEIDSGLDIDALKTVALGANTLLTAADSSRRTDRAMVLVTHYERLLHYIQPTHVHVLYKGLIHQSGGPDLARDLEREGYARFGIEDELAGAGAR